MALLKHINANYYPPLLIILPILPHPGLALPSNCRSNMNLQICFMNEDSETIEIDGSTIRGVVEGLEADAFPSTGASGQKTADDAFNSTLTPSATLVAQHSQSSMEDGVDAAEKAAAAAEDAAAGGSLMKNSKSVGHFLHCLLPGEKPKMCHISGRDPKVVRFSSNLILMSRNEHKLF